MHVVQGWTVVKNAAGAPTLEGATPVLELDEDHNTWWIPYCYYTPTEKGEIFLSYRASFSIQYFICNIYN